MGKKKPKREKITNESLLAKMKFDFSRDAEWFKRTNQKIQETKEDLNKNFYDENKKKQKIDFIHKLQDKLKDYKDAIKFESRYKKVRFVERRKLERKLNHINKSIQNEKDEVKIKKLKDEKNNIIEDINYVKFYPKTYKYYSLFPNKDSQNEEMIKKREKMKQIIKFYLNGKKNKKNENTSDDERQERGEGMKDQSEKNDEDEKDINKDIKNKKEERKNNRKKINENNNIEIDKKDKKDKKEFSGDYEYSKKKKAFKDDFFELDE